MAPMRSVGRFVLQSGGRWAPRALLIACLTLTVAAAPLVAWSGTGHRVVGVLAGMQLEPATLARVESLLALIDAGPTIADGAVWMDVIRANDLRSFDRWHYINIPYTVEGQPPVPAKDENVIWAIERARRALADPTLSERRRAFYVAVLLHTVGDIHQPMHCVGRISRAFPEGDRGGNDFALAEPWRNLHRLWDRTADYLPHITESDHAALRAHATRIAERHPKASLEHAENLDPQRWADESYHLATAVAYAGLTEGEHPSEAYLIRAREVVGPRLALAAYRLAAVLEEALAVVQPR